MKKKTSTANPVKVEIESLLCAIKKRRQQPDGFGNLLFAGQHRHTIAVLRAIAAQSSFRFSVWFLLPDFQEKSSQNDIKMPQHFVMRGFISHRIRNHRNTRHALLPIAILDRKPIGIYFVNEDIFTLASYYQTDMREQKFFPSPDWQMLPDDQEEGRRDLLE